MINYIISDFNRFINYNITIEYKLDYDEFDIRFNFKN